jgi:hypothetical protein
VDLNRARGYESLEIECDAILDTLGTYEITPVIQAGPECGPWMLGSTAFAMNGVEFKVKTDSLGHIRFTADFQGDDLWRFEVNGPWVFCCRFLCLDNIDPVTHHPPGYAWIEQDLSAATRPWRYEQFARHHGGELDPFEGAPFDVRTGEDLVYTQGNDLVVATILAADSSGTTDSPPHVLLRVDERLYGRLRTGPVESRWLPWPLYMPCPTGEEGRIARWHAARIPTPKVGTRWILGGRRASPHAEWGCEPMCRWVYSDSLRTHFVAAARKWPARMRMLRRESAIARGPWIREQRRIEALGRRQVASEAREQWNLQRRWLARERRIEHAVDIKRLVQSSSDMVIAEPFISPDGGEQRGSLDGAEWLRQSHTISARRRQVSLFIGQHEDSVAWRWSTRPALPTSGRHAKDSRRCIAFLGLAHDSLSFFMPRPEYRIMDGEVGLMMADRSTLARVKAAMRAIPAYRPGRCADCEATLSEFAGLSETEAARVGVKLTPTTAVGNAIRASGMVLKCPEMDRVRTLYGTPLTHGSFPLGALSSGRYAMDYVSNDAGAYALPAQMKTLLDSLVAQRASFEHRINAADSVSLMLRRFVGGRERVFECTLDTTSFLRFVRILTRVFSYQEVVRMGNDYHMKLAYWGISSWTYGVEPRAQELWDTSRYP